jgi:putative transcriptional regulator
MSIKYDKLFALLKEKGYSTYRIRQENVVSQAALTKMKNGIGDIDTRTIERLCAVLQCQPGDIMEYAEDNT